MTGDRFDEGMHLLRAHRRRPYFTVTAATAPLLCRESL